MNLNPKRLWPVVLALGWLLDFLFWKRLPGINFAIYAILCLAGGFYVLMSAGVRPSRQALLILPLVLFFAVVTFVRAEPLTVLLATGSTLALMALLAVTYGGARWLQFRFPDYVTGFARLLGSIALRPLAYAEEARMSRKTDAGRRGWTVWPIVRGVLLALPVLALFAALLASADLVFGRRLDTFLEFFRLERLPEYLFRVAYMLAAAYALAGVLLHAAARSAEPSRSPQKGLGLSRFLGSTEAAIVLGSVAGLFASFVLIQFRYFFGGQANISAEGFTYAEYARRGFGELVTVAFFTLLLIMMLSAVTRRETSAQRRTFSALVACLVALVLVMLVSAYQRLLLYEAAYGFSRLRSYTHVFLVWVGLLLVATALLEILRREQAFALAAVAAALGFAASLAILNVDAFIATRNVNREIAALVGPGPERGAELDAQYFLQLSDDGIPPLVSAFRDAGTPASVKDQLGAALSCMRYWSEQQPLGGRSQAWQSFHVAHHSAARALAGLGTELEPYVVEGEGGLVVVHTPLDGGFPCRSDFD